MEKNESEKLTFRRQFVLGPSYIQEFSHWKKIQIAEKSFLTVHPELDYCTSSNDKYSIHLLGFLLDPVNHDFTNFDIVNEICSRCKSFDDVIKSSFEYGGRFIIIYTDKNGTRIFHDAAGFRQVYYYSNTQGFWCASQPHVLANYLKIPNNDDPLLLDFINSEEYTKCQHSWPGSGTMYKDVYHLLPNFYLDIFSGKCQRYWPVNNPLQILTCNEAAIQASKILTGLLKSAHKRFKLSLAVTAGWDSRTLLAASKDIKDDIVYFVQKFGTMKDSHIDIKVPLKLCQKLGVHFQINKCEKKIDDTFLEIFKQNVCAFQNIDKICLHYDFYKNSQDFVTVGGNVSEIARLYYGECPDITPEKLASLYGYQDDEYAISSFKTWLSNAITAANNSGIDILDLFYWEQRLGNWGAMFSSELDIAIEELHPFNCRNLLIKLLSVDKKFRKKDHNVLYLTLIKIMWSEALKIPIYPTIIRSKLKKIIKSILKK